MLALPILPGAVLDKATSQIRKETNHGGTENTEVRWQGDASEEDYREGAKTRSKKEKSFSFLFASSRLRAFAVIRLGELQTASAPPCLRG
jgi:hypothetical protein